MPSLFILLLLHFDPQPRTFLEYLDVCFYIFQLSKTSIEANYTYSTHRAGNTLFLGYKTSRLMLYREIVAVCSQIHTKHTYTVWTERRTVHCFKTGGTYEGVLIDP